MRLLDFMIDPPGYCERHGVEWPNIVAGGLNSIIEVALPDLAGDRPFLETLGSDLSRQGLIDNPGFYSMMSPAGLHAGRGTSKAQSSWLSSPARSMQASERSSAQNDGSGWRRRGEGATAGRFRHGGSILQNLELSGSTLSYSVRSGIPRGEPQDQRPDNMHCQPRIADSRLGLFVGVAGLAPVGRRPIQEGEDAGSQLFVLAGKQTSTVVSCRDH